MNQVELLEKLADLIFEFKNDYEEKLREQIAREIEAVCHVGCGLIYNCGHKASQILRCDRGCDHKITAAIARGEK